MIESRVVQFLVKGLFEPWKSISGFQVAAVNKAAQMYQEQEIYCCSDKKSCKNIINTGVTGNLLSKPQSLAEGFDILLIIVLVGRSISDNLG